MFAAWCCRNDCKELRCHPGLHRTVILISMVNMLQTYILACALFTLPGCSVCRMITSGVAGLLCLAAFCVLQTFVSVYRGRLVGHTLNLQSPACKENPQLMHTFCLMVHLCTAAAVSPSGHQAPNLYRQRHRQVFVSVGSMIQDRILRLYRTHVSLQGAICTDQHELHRS